MSAGRPKEYDRVKVAEELIEWVKIPTSINLNNFCVTRKDRLNPRHVSQFAKESDEFREAYEWVKAVLADRREQWLNSDTLHVKAYDLNASVYDFFLKEEKREQAKFEAEIAVKDEKSISPFQSEIDLRHENMLVKAELAGYKEANANK